MRAGETVRTNHTFMILERTPAGIPESAGRGWQVSNLSARSRATFGTKKRLVFTERSRDDARNSNAAIHSLPCHGRSSVAMRPVVYHVSASTNGLDFEGAEWRVRFIGQLVCELVSL